MRILLLNPRYRDTFFTLTGARPITNKFGFMANLALPTLAAMTPEDIDVRIVDEEVEEVDYDTPCDLVGITGYITQRNRMIEMAEAFRSRGIPVAIGGPYASLSPDTLRPHADILFRGEAEETWPAFLEDFRAGAWKDEYFQEGNVDFTTSPQPKVEKMHNDRYYMGAVQTSRGCPFECEFCDVIVYLGRRQRYKDPDQVCAEVDHLYDVGYRQVFLSDDNFTANRHKAADLLRALCEWNKDRPQRIAFDTQMSIDAARDQDVPLLDLCVEAGLALAFVGIETPSTDALLEVKKRQNARYDMLSHVARLHEHGIMVQAGMIVGFDADRTNVFNTQFEFAQEAGTAVTSLSMLNAPEGTPLEARLKAAGRLQPWPIDDVYSATNIIPKQMTTEQLVAGTHWLANKLYEPNAFVDRMAVLANQLPVHKSTDRVGREAGLMWDRVVHTYERLGPEFEMVPRRGAELFRKKNFSHLMTCLLFYCHFVRMLRKQNIWNPELARAAEPVW